MANREFLPITTDLTLSNQAFITRRSSGSRQNSRRRHKRARYGLALGAAKYILSTHGCLDTAPEKQQDTTSFPSVLEHLSEDEVEIFGQAIYEAEIRPFVEIEENIGKYLVLDVRTKEWEMDRQPLPPNLRLLAKHPDAMLYGVRIGFDVEAEVKTVR